MCKKLYFLIYLSSFFYKIFIKAVFINISSTKETIENSFSEDSPVS